MLSIKHKLVKPMQVGELPVQFPLTHFNCLKPLRRNPSSHAKETDTPCPVALLFTVPLAGG